MHVLMASSAVFFIFLLVTLLLTASSDLTQDTKALTSFITQIPPACGCYWNTSQPTCTWTGVTCNAASSSVIYLQLPAAGLVGEIPPLTIGTMTSLRNLSLHTNALSGAFPNDFANLTELRYVNLHNNNFSGQFPSSVTKWTELVTLDLSNNNFSGMLPDNVSSGKLENFNVSNNNLSGPIPQSLIRFSKEAFTGNVYLCGEPLPPCNGSLTPPPSPSPGPSESFKPETKKNNKLSTGAIVAIAVGSPLTLLTLLSCLGKKLLRKVLSCLGKKLLQNLCSCFGKKRSRAGKEKKAQEVATMAAKDVPVAGWGEDLLT